MNNTQRSLLAIFIPMTILIIIFDNIFPRENMVNYIRYAIIIALFIVSISIKKKFHEQMLMALSFFFVVIADFFLVFSNTIDKIKMDLTPFGIAGFICAYICLIVAYQKNFGRAKKAEIISAIPIVIIFIMVGMPLFKNVIWIAYIIGWTLLNIVISEEKVLY